MAAAPAAGAAGKKDAEAWPALESNPEVMTNFVRELTGVKTLEVCDVFGLDPELLGMVPQPVHALIVCFPSSATPKSERGADFGKIPEGEVAESAFYLKQVPTLTNACGTVALVHALANTPSVCPETSPLGKYVKAQAGASFQDRGDALFGNAELNALHLRFAHQGDTQVLESDAVQHHYSCYVDVGGNLVECDGAYKTAPHNLGKIGDEGFLAAAAKHMQQNVIAGREDMTFSLVALTSSS